MKNQRIMIPPKEANKASIMNLKEIEIQKLVADKSK